MGNCFTNDSIDQTRKRSSLNNMEPEIKPKAYGSKGSLRSDKENGNYKNETNGREDNESPAKDRKADYQYDSNLSARAKGDNKLQSRADLGLKDEPKSVFRADDGNDEVKPPCPIFL